MAIQVGFAVISSCIYYVHFVFIMFLHLCPRVDAFAVAVLCSVGYSHILSRALISPSFSLRGPAGLSADQMRCNTRMAKLRISSEWMFKDVTQLWQYLKFFSGLKIRLQPVGMFYIVAADLTNLHTILRRQCQTSLFFDCHPPSLDEYLAPRGYVDGLDFDVAIDEQLAVVKEEAVGAVVQPFDAMDDMTVQARLELFAFAEDDDVIAPPLDLDGRVDPALLPYWFWQQQHHAGSRSPRPRTASV